MKIRSHRFSLVEIIMAIAVFAMAALYLMERRNTSLEKSYYAVQLLKAQEIVDEVLQQYRLYPFSKEVLPIDFEKYHPFIVEANVTEESINILPEEWQMDELLLTESEKEKQRIILRVDVDVKFSDFAGTKKDFYNYNISTLIRHIELKEKKEGS